MSRARGGSVPSTVPGSWRRQLGGTLRGQLADLRADVERNALGSAVVAGQGAELNRTDRAVLALLTVRAVEMRPREIEAGIAMGRASVGESLHRLERLRRVVRRAVPCPQGARAFAWRVAV